MPVGRDNYTARLRADEVAYVQIIASPDPAVVGQIYALDHVRTSFGATRCSNVAVVTSIHFPTGDIARNNTTISRDASGVFWVADFNSGPTTSLNGTPLYTQRKPLMIGDVIELGGGIVRLVFRGALLTPDDPAPLSVPDADT